MCNSYKVKTHLTSKQKRRQKREERRKLYISAAKKREAQTISNTTSILKDVAV